MGKIPWHIPSELLHFKNTTIGFPVIMGRKTYESLSGLLPGRVNIILTGNKDYRTYDNNIKVFNSFDNAVDFCENMNFTKVFIIGGGKIFSETIEKVDQLILSYLDISVQGDTYFPELNYNIWAEEKTEEKEGFKIITYSRKKK